MLKKGKKGVPSQIVIIDHSIQSLKTSLTRIHKSPNPRLTLNPSLKHSPHRPTLLSTKNVLKENNCHHTNNSKAFKNKKTKKQHLSKATSLEKKKSKMHLKKPTKQQDSKALRQMATKETHQTIHEISMANEQWKENLKLTFRSKNQQSAKASINESLQCLQKIYQLSSSERQSENNFAVFNSSFGNKALMKDVPLLTGPQRVILIDWLCLTANELMLKRETLHLAIIYIDAYLDVQQAQCHKFYLIAAASLYLAVKQEERGSQHDVLAALAQCHHSITKQSMIELENRIVLKLGFKLNFNTLPFWIDYFSQKWDRFVTGKRGRRIMTEIGLDLKGYVLLLRNPEGLSYKYYRQLCQIIDLLLMDVDYRKFDYCKLALASLYLVLRIETEIAFKVSRNRVQMQKLQEKDVSEISCIKWLEFYQQFKRKASPIFKDALRINEVFNEFLTEVCSFQITQIIPSIKYIGGFLNLPLHCEIDGRLYEISCNYEQFLRLMSYSPDNKQFMLERFSRRAVGVFQL